MISSTHNRDPHPSADRPPTLARFGTALGLGLCICLAACGPPKETAVATRTVRTTLFSLLSSYTAANTRLAPQGTTPRVGLLEPTRHGMGLGASLPALIMEGDSLVELPLPAGSPGRELFLGLALHPAAWQGGQVTARIWAGENLLHEVRIDCNAETPMAQRVWRETSLALPSETCPIGLETVWEGKTGDTRILGFGRLEVHTPGHVTPLPTDSKRPNVLLIVVDTLRADRLGQGGNHRSTSPVMDAIASRGARFSQAYSSGPWTLPGTASILTGLTPPEHGIGSSPSSSLAHPLASLPEFFQRQGWLTGGFAMNPLISARHCFDQGFDTLTSRRWALARDHEQDWLGWLGEHAHERFFLYLHLIEPHYPYMPSHESCDALGIKPAEGEDHLDPRLVLRRWYEDGVGSPEALRQMSSRQLDLYDAEVLDADAAIGRVLEQLAKLGIENNTVVCVTSDHGEEFLEHGWAQHDAQLWSESTHVPLIFAGPGVPQGKVFEGPLENRHLAPTLLALAGIQQAAMETARDLLDPVAFELALEEGAYAMHTQGRWCDLESREVIRLDQTHALRRGPWELISCPNNNRQGSSPIIRLYNTDRDPTRAWDLSGEEPARTQQMRAEIETWIQSGLSRQPSQVPTAAETLSMLEGLGYGGGK